MSPTVPLMDALPNSSWCADARRRHQGARRPSRQPAARRRHRPRRQHPPRHRRAAGADRRERRRRAAHHQGRRARDSRSAPSVTLAELAEHPDVVAALSGGGAGRRASSPGRRIATWARSAAISASTRAASSTIRANGGAPPINHCLKTTGEICHVAPKSRGVCFATFSGDLAPALLTLGAEVDLAGPTGRRTLPLAAASTSAMRARISRSPRRGRRQVLSVAAARRARHRGARAATRPACARPTTRSASAARSSIRSAASRWRCAATATRSPICASPSPAPIRARCCSKAPHALCGGPLDDARAQGPRRSRARPDHVDEDDLHARPLPPPRRRRAGAPPADCGCSRLEPPRVPRALHGPPFQPPRPSTFFRTCRWQCCSSSAQ